MKSITNKLGKELIVPTIPFKKEKIGIAYIMPCCNRVIPSITKIDTANVFLDNRPAVAIRCPYMDCKCIIVTSSTSRYQIGKYKG